MVMGSTSRQLGTWQVAGVRNRKLKEIGVVSDRQRRGDTFSAHLFYVARNRTSPHRGAKAGNVQILGERGELIAARGA